MEDLMIDAAVGRYGPTLGVVASASFGAVRVVRASWPEAPSWLLRSLSAGVGAASGVATWGGYEGATVGALTGLASTVVVAAMRARAARRG